MNISSLIMSLLLGSTIAMTGFSQKRTSSPSKKVREYCADAGSRREMDECQQKIRSKVEAILNRVYGKLAQSFDSSGKEKLRQSQQAWEKYREATCELATDLKFQTCIIEMTRKRTVELQDFASQFLREGNRGNIAN